MNPSLAYRFCARPIALDMNYARTLIASILQESALIRPRAMDDDGDYPTNRDEGMLPYIVHEGGLAEIPISGVLVHKEEWYSQYIGETGYGRITSAALAAVSDPNVKAIVFHIESPGGEVDGCFEAADLLYSLRGSKPLLAVCDSYAYSAAYALASACDSICVPRTGGTGSVGVVSMHMEMSKMLDQMGIKFTPIQFGDRKTDGSPYTPLSKRAEEKIQADVDVLGEMFVDLVARNRGMTASAVRATQASVFMGKDGVSIGFADAVCDPDEAFQRLQLEILTRSLS